MSHSLVRLSLGENWRLKSCDGCGYAIRATHYGHQGTRHVRENSTRRVGWEIYGFRLTSRHRPTTARSD